MIRTIIFDIGNVLAGFDWRSFYEKQGFDESMLERLARATVLSEDWKEYDRGCVSDEGMLELFVENDPEIENQIRSALADFHGLVTHYDYSISWICELKQKGYQILVLSNFSEKALKECWGSLDFLPYVDGGILSFRDKLVKPMPEIYQLILSRYRLKAEECVFLDDTQANVDAAIKAGMHALRFVNRQQAEEELKKLGVE